MTQSEMAELLKHIQQEEMEVREAGQAEYAHDSSNAFRNFEAIADYLGLDRKEVLLVYAIKHMDGIVSWVRGHTSQREDIRGRIKDLRMYLALLWGMVEEEEENLLEEIFGEVDEETNIPKAFNGYCSNCRAFYTGSTCPVCPNDSAELQMAKGEINDVYD